MNENFLKNLKQALSETAEVVTKKTEDVVEVQKLRSKIYNAKKNVEVDYKKLGTIIYQRYLSGESMDEELVNICESIHDLLEQAEKYKDELAEKKGLNICDVCDASNPKDAVFCMKCGSKLPVKEACTETCEEECPEGCPEDCFEDEECAEGTCTEEDIIDVPTEEQQKLLKYDLPIKKFPSE